jgi:ribosome-binding ATPase
MKIGLIGLPGSGKTTVFNALTGSKADTQSYGGKLEPNMAVVTVRDERITRLAEIYQPRKTTYASIEIIDFAGLVQDASKKELFPGKAMGLIKNVHALALVIRNFRNGLNEDLSPFGDMALIEAELILNDLIVAENRLERIEKSFSRGQGANILKTEEKLLEKICDQLNHNRPIRQLDFSVEEEKMIRGFQFLTQKPVFVVLNSDESNFGSSGSILDEIETRYDVIEFAGAFEMELSRLEASEAEIFMQDMGIKESARDRLTVLAYRIMDYISFFTVGQDEVRAWTLRKGMTAVDAAGTIHSDLARGFIRAECFTYSDLVEYGSEKAVKEKGRFRLEGKEYLVKDSDILSIRSGV